MGGVLGENDESLSSSDEFECMEIVGLEESTSKVSEDEEEGLRSTSMNEEGVSTIFEI